MAACGAAVRCGCCADRGGHGRLTGAGRQVGLPVLVGGEPRWRFRARATVNDLDRRGKVSLRHGCYVAGPIPRRHACDDKAARNRPLTRGQKLKLSNTALVAVRGDRRARLCPRQGLARPRQGAHRPAWATALVRALLSLTNRA
jgi:hypothetical protein